MGIQRLRGRDLNALAIRIELTRILQVAIVRSFGHLLALGHNDGEPGAKGMMYWTGLSGYAACAITESVRAAKLRVRAAMPRVSRAIFDRVTAFSPKN